MLNVTPGINCWSDFSHKIVKRIESKGPLKSGVGANPTSYLTAKAVPQNEILYIVCIL